MPIKGDIKKRETRHGMTLLEVILAITLAGFVLTAATSFVVSVSSIWVDREERYFFEDHVDGVTEFLQASLSNAGTEIALGSGENTDSGVDTNQTDSTRDRDQADTSSSSLIHVPDAPINWERPPGFADYREPLLHFKLIETPPLLVNIDDAPSVGVDIFLHFDADDGLSLLWYSSLQETSENIDDLRRTQISALVEKVQYIYWDETFENWETEDAPMEGEGDDEYLLPRFIKLTFEYEGETMERTLTIPVPSQNALIF